MKRVLLQLVVVVIFVTATALPADSQALVNGGSRVQNDPPIKISAPRYRWLRISNQPAAEFNLPGQKVKTPGMAMLREEVNILYEKGSYIQDKVKLVTELTIANKDGKLSSYQAGVEREMKTATGKLWAVWAVSGISVSGRGVIKIYLTENKKNGKIVSNTLSIPVAADAEAERQLESELGTWLVPAQPIP